MFGLTRREQRWKAEQQAAELVVGLLVATVNAVGSAATAAALAQAKSDELEIERLRARVAELESKP